MLYTDYFWDFDGTLFDSYPYIVDRFQRGACALGIETDREEVLALAKRSLVYLCEVLGERLGLDPAQLREAYRAHGDPQAYARIQPFEGIPALLEGIVSAGGRNYLYTHSGAEVLGALARHDLSRLFADHIISPNDFPPKPAPDALLAKLAEHRLAPARCAMVGDRDIDTLAGQRAGMAGVLFDPDGYYADAPVEHRFTSIADMQRAFMQA